MRRTQQQKSGIKNPLGFLATLLVGAAGISNSSGAVIFSDNFNSYSSGALTNQGSWLATAAAATPIQVSGGRAQLATAGQDAYAAFGSPTSNTDGTSLFVGLTINVASAQATGDYFFHLSNPAGTTSFFYDRLFARSSGGGFQLGFVDTAGTGSTITWGSTVLSLATDYRIVLGQNFVAGTVNDTFSLYVDPTDTLVEGNNSTYLTHTWTSASAESAIYAAVNLRQGSASQAAAVAVDDILISKTFSEVSAVPEPASAVIFGVSGLLAFMVIRRRR